jgi:hypothetical protein
MPSLKLVEPMDKFRPSKRWSYGTRPPIFADAPAINIMELAT